MLIALANSSGVPRSIGTNGSSAAWNSPSASGWSTSMMPRAVNPSPAYALDHHSPERVTHHERGVELECPHDRVHIGRKRDRVVRCAAFGLAVTA